MRLALAGLGFAAILAGLLWLLGIFEPGLDEPHRALLPIDDIVDVEATGLVGRGTDAPMETELFGDISDWRELLARADVRTQDAWSKRMAEVGASREAIDELIESLRSRHDATRAETGLHVGWIQQALFAIGALALPALVEALEDHEAELRERVAKVLGWFGPKAAPATEIALRIAQDPRASVYERAAMVTLLASIGPDAKGALPFLHGVVRRENDAEEVENAALYALYRIAGVDDEVLETYSIVLRGEWWNARLSVLALIVEIGAGAAPLVLDVLALLDEGQEVRLHQPAVRALQAIGKAEPSVVTKLTDWIDEPPDRDSVLLAVRALAQLGPKGRAALAEAALHAHPYYRARAALRLAENGVAEERLLPLLPELFGAERSHYAEEALSALTKIPTRAENTWAWLERFATAEDGSGDERSLAHVAMFALRDPPPKAFELLDAAIADMETKKNGAWYQSDFGPEFIDFGAVTNAEMLRRALAFERSENPILRAGLAYALRTAPADMQAQAVDALLRLLDDEDPSVLRNVAISLGSLGAPAERAVPAMRRRLAGLREAPQRHFVVAALEQAVQRLTDGQG